MSYNKNLIPINKYYKHKGEIFMFNPRIKPIKEQIDRPDTEIELAKTKMSFTFSRSIRLSICMLNELWLSFLSLPPNTYLLKSVQIFESIVQKPKEKSSLIWNFNSILFSSQQILNVATYIWG